MTLERGTLVIFLLAGAIGALDLGSFNRLEEIIEFVEGIADAVDGEKIRAAGELLDGFRIDQLPTSGDVVRKYFLEVPHRQVTDQEIFQLETLVRRMDQAWMEFGSKDGAGLEEFVKTMPEILNELYSFYTGGAQGGPGFPSRVNADWPWCYEMTRNFQIRFQKLHQVLILAELKGFVLALKASEDPRKSAARVVFYSAQYLAVSHAAIQNAFKVKSRCDPPEHIRGETFTEFLGLFQGLVLNEAQSDINSDDRCQNECVSLENTQMTRCYNDSIDDQIVPRCHIKPCHGELIECYDFEDQTQACELKEDSDRRFLWVKNSLNNVQYGSDFDTCPGRLVEFKIKSSSTGTSWCKNCVCTCAEIEGNSTATRTISLIPQVADISNNMVMTGIRFAEKNRMIHVQIEQAKFAPFGEILLGTEEWKELGDFEYDSKGEGSWRMKTADGFVKLQEFVDFSFLALDQRTFNLDQILANEGQVLVGARIVANADEDAFELEILSWPVDIRTGKLASGDPGTRWVGWRNAQRRHLNYNSPRFESEVGYVFEPLGSTTNPEFSLPNQKLLVRGTAYTIDMAQHTVPYLDLQPVTWPDGRVPLEGLELIYYRAEFYGGFLGFKIFSVDLSDEFKWKISASAFNKHRPYFDGNLPLQVF